MNPEEERGWGAIDPGVFPKRRLQFVLHEESIHSGEGWAAGVEVAAQSST